MIIVITYSKFVNYLKFYCLTFASAFAYVTSYLLCCCNFFCFFLYV